MREANYNVSQCGEPSALRCCLLETLSVVQNAEVIKLEGKCELPLCPVLIHCLRLSLTTECYESMSCWCVFTLYLGCGALPSDNRFLESLTVLMQYCQPEELPWVYWLNLVTHWWLQQRVVLLGAGWLESNQYFSVLAVCWTTNQEVLWWVKDWLWE